MIITIARGDVYRRMAELTVPLMEECLGHPVTVLQGAPDSWATKLEVLSGEVYTFIDVDVVFRRPYDLTDDWAHAKDGAFVAPEPEYRARLRLPDTFVTSGMFTCNPMMHADMFELARSRYRPGGGLKDEHALNEALQALHVPIRRLPLRVHRVPHCGAPLSPEDVSRHYCGGACDNLVRLSHIRDAADEAWRHLGETHVVCAPERKPDTWIADARRPNQ